VNFLAHAFLAGEQPVDRLGGLIGDFVKGVLPAGLPLVLAEGVRLHRRIDTFADRQMAFLRSRSRISPLRRRVGGIMIDMFYDHFLACHWPMFSDQPLERFAADMYALIHAHLPLLPDRVAAIFPYMRDEDWLSGYRSVARVSSALDNMGRRMQRTGLLEGAGVELTAHYHAFERDFFDFIADAQVFAEQYRQRRGQMPPLSA